MIRPLTILALAAFAVVPQASARPASTKVNVREACRQAMAGRYLTVYDQKALADQWLRTASSQRETAEKAWSAAAAELAAAKKKDLGFDVDHVALVDSLEIRVRTLHDLKTHYETLEKVARENAPRAAAKEKSARERYARVFTFERLDDAPGGGYPIYIAYKSACPTFRALCSLPRDDASALISLEKDPPEECLRYASLSRIR